jgi:hypothetical protein
VKHNLSKAAIRYSFTELQKGRIACQALLVKGLPRTKRARARADSRPILLPQRETEFCEQGDGRRDVLEAMLGSQDDSISSIVQGVEDFKNAIDNSARQCLAQLGALGSTPSSPPAT